MSRRLSLTIGLLAALVPAAASSLAHAQTNIDQGKSPAQMFASDCAVCHKAARGLANGRNSFTLASFLAEHYTSGRQQAAALAAYVLGAGGNDAAAAAAAAKGRGQKPGPENARATVEEPKNGVHAMRPPATKPEEEKPATAKLQRPEDETKPEAEPGVSGEPGLGGAAGRPTRPVTATRGSRKKELAPEPQQLPAVLAVPAEVPSQEPNPATSVATSPAAPAEAQPDENSSVPRDNIPD